MTDISQFLAIFDSNVYLRSLGILIGFFIASKLFIYVSQKVFLRLTKRTKTEIDDLLIKNTNGVISVILIFIGLRLAFLPLKFPESVTPVVDKILSSAIYFLVGWGIIKVANILIGVWGRKWAESTENTLDDQLVGIFQKIVIIVIAVLVLLFILTVWNVEILPLLGSLGIAGLGIALALQGTLSNIFGGISVILDKSIKVGDVIEVDENTVGRVVEVGLRSTKISTFNNELIVVPNAKISESMVINYALPDLTARAVIPFGVAYGSDIDKVKKLVLKQIKSIDLIAKDPEPIVRFVEMGDSALLFKAYFWVGEYGKRFLAKDMANTKIYNALNKAGIEIPFPQMDVHLRKD